MIFLRCLKIYLLTFFCISLAYAEGNSGYLQFFETNKKEFSIGETFRAEMHLYPAFGLNDYKNISLKGQMLFQLFYVVNVNTIRISENNQDVLIIDFLLTSIRAYDKPGTYPFEVEGRTYQVSLDKLGILKNDIKEMPKTYVIMEQSVSIPKSYYFYGFLLGLVIIIGLWRIRKRKNNLLVVQEKHKKETEIKEKNMKWAQLFTRAVTRSDFETIYTNKEEWIALSGGTVTTSMHLFFSVVEREQYKRDWGPKEISEITQAFDAIRNTFKKNGI